MTTPIPGWAITTLAVLAGLILILTLALVVSLIHWRLSCRTILRAMAGRGWVSLPAIWSPAKLGRLAYLDRRTIEGYLLWMEAEGWVEAEWLDVGEKIYRISAKGWRRIGGLT